MYHLTLFIFNQGDVKMTAEKNPQIISESAAFQQRFAEHLISKGFTYNFGEQMVEDAPNKENIVQDYFEGLDYKLIGFVSDPVVLNNQDDLVTHFVLVEDRFLVKMDTDIPSGSETYTKFYFTDFWVKNPENFKLSVDFFNEFVGNLMSCQINTVMDSLMLNCDDESISDKFSLDLKNTANKLMDEIFNEED